MYAKNYRLKLFNDWNIKLILDCTDFQIFKDATVRNIICLLRKSQDKQDHLYYKNTSNTSDIWEVLRRPKRKASKKIVEEINLNWGLIFKLPEEVLNLVAKIKKNSRPLNFYFPEVSQGLIAYDKYRGQDQEIIKNRAYHSNKKENDSFKEWLFGEDVQRYRIDWNGKEYINYCDGIANPREPKFFKGERVLIREITNPSIYAAYTDQEYYNDPAVIIVLDNKKSSISALALTGILNSKLATFLHFNSSPKATKGSFPKILVYDIYNFPLPKNINNQSNKVLSNISKNIHESKKSKPNSITTEWENQIDLLVYKLYDLSYEECQVVDPELDSVLSRFGLDKEEFERMGVEEMAGNV